MKTASLLPVLLLFTLVAGCTPERPPPVLNLSGVTCDSDIQLDKALAVPAVNRPKETAFDALEKLSLSTELKVDIRPETSCVDIAGEKASYLVLSLPTVRTPYRITLNSEVLDGRVWALTARLFDEGRQSTREFSFDRFFAFDGSFQIEIYPKPSERYLVLKSDKERIARLDTQSATLSRNEPVAIMRSREICNGKGKKRHCRSESYSDTASVSVPYLGAVNYQYAHDGRITASIRYIEPKNVPPDQL